MEVHELLTDLFDRLSEHVHDVVEGLETRDLLTGPAPGANPIGWLLWHVARVQDHHVSEILGREQVWMGGDWASKFGLTPEPHNVGYGHTPEEVAAVRPASPQVLADYYDAVDAPTRQLLGTITPSDLDRIVDRRWDPPVTLGVRLVSIADDGTQHAGQAAYLKGLRSLS